MIKGTDGVSAMSAEFCPRKVWVRGTIAGASYSGCDGWSGWVIREIRFRCDADKVADAKARAARRIEATSGTYTRRSVAWQQNTADDRR